MLHVDVVATTDKRDLNKEDGEPDDQGTHASDEEQVDVTEDNGGSRTDQDEFPGVSNVSDVTSHLVVHNSLVEKFLEGLDGFVAEGADAIRFTIEGGYAETVQLLCVVPVGEHRTLWNVRWIYARVGFDIDTVFFEEILADHVGATHEVRTGRHVSCDLALDGVSLVCGGALFHAGSVL